MNRSDKPGDHLRPEDISAYLERVLSAEEASSVELHLATCATCRGEVRETVRILESAPSRRPSRGRLMTAVTAAAAVLLVVYVALPQPDSDEPTLRADEAGLGTPAIQAVTPSAGAELDAAFPLVFAWRPAAGADVMYTITVTDESGTVVWTSDTADTTIALPASGRLGPGQLYHWYVDALVAGARGVSTGVQQFRTAP